MLDHRAIIQALGGYRAAALKMTMPVGRVRFWDRRNNIPPEHFPAVVSSAQREGLDWVTEKFLFASRRESAAPAANDSEGERAGAA